MVEKSKLDEDEEGKAVDLSHYRGMIGTLLYLTANADHAGCQDTRRSTSGSIQFLEDRVPRWDVLACFTIFLNILFDAECEFDSSDDQSLSDEDFLKKIFSNPLFEEETIFTKIDPHHFNAESDLIESMLNHDSFIISSSSKIDSLLDEFAGELTLLKSIPPGIDETDCDPENEFRLTKRLLYDNSSPRPLEEFVSKNSNADIESFFPSPIPNEDSDSHMEEIDLTFTPDDPMPPSIEEDDDDSERDILILEELFDNYSLSLLVIESFYFDIPLFSCPPAKPPDGNTRILNIKMIAFFYMPDDDSWKEHSYPGCSSFPFLPLDQFNLLHLAGSQPMLKSSYKADDGVIISIPPLVGGVADVVVEIKGTGVYYDYDQKGRISDDDFSSNNNESFSDEDILKKIYLNPIFYEEIISIKIDPHHFNAEFDLIESLLNHDSLIISSSSNIDSLLDEFVGELTLLKSIPPGIDETDYDHKEEICLIKKFLYDNSSPRPLKEFISKNSDAAIEFFSPSPIPVEDGDSFMEEIDLSFTPNDSMPPGIEEDDYDSERDILILEDLLSNDSFSLSENESFHFDIPSPSRPPAKPPDGNS
nr:hypothetical protein [Tanacetum cinerariifolium]